MENGTKYALITGGTAGIGFELAKLFAKDKYNLILVSRDQQNLDNASQQLKQEGIDVITISKDLFNRDEAFALCQEIKDLGIAVDVLVNDAGQGVYGLFKDNDIERELKIIDLNIASLTILTKHFLNEMIARNDGKILNLASIASETPGPWQAVYHGTKAYVLSITEAIREEVKDTNITITALLPGPTATDFFNKAGMQDSRILQKESMISDPADVAKDGYNALMSGADKITSGFQNKIMVGMSHITPDTMVAHNMNEMQKPVDKE
jgi:short-subunit dehydrogenase